MSGLIGIEEFEIPRIDHPDWEKIFSHWSLAQVVHELNAFYRAQNSSLSVTRSLAPQNEKDGFGEASHNRHIILFENSGGWQIKLFVNEPSSRHSGPLFFDRECSPVIDDILIYTGDYAVTLPAVLRAHASAAHFLDAVVAFWSAQLSEEKIEKKNGKGEPVVAAAP